MMGLSEFVPFGREINLLGRDWGEVVRRRILGVVCEGFSHLKNERIQNQLRAGL